MQDDFEKQFVQDVKMNTTQAGVFSTNVMSPSGNFPANVPRSGEVPDKGGSKILLIILVISIVNMVAIIILGVAVLSLPRSVKGESVATIDVDDEDDDEEADYIMDKSGNITALRVSCTNSDSGASFTFKDDNTYVEQDSSNKRTSGTYGVVRNELVTIKSGGKERTLYYDGFFVADGATIYDCE